MYLGNIVGQATAKEIFEHPIHPYTKLLINSILFPDRRSEKLKKENSEYKNSIFDIKDNDIGCPFKKRCSRITEKCINKKPELKEIEKEPLVTCFKFN